MFKLLTICIPTYNRSRFAILQLEFLSTEIAQYSDLIEIKVADNCSTAEHAEELARYKSKNNFFELISNNENLGLIGNVYKLLSYAESEYVWFLGDDDVLLPGILTEIVDALKTNKVNYVFMNFNAFIDTPHNIIASNDLLGYKGLVENDETFSSHFFNKNGTACMFLSASIYKTSLISSISRLNRIPSITDPLLFFFHAAQGPLYVVEKVFVLDRLSQISWAGEQYDVFSWKVPATIAELTEVGSYSQRAVVDMLYNYYEKEKNYLIMLVKAPSYVRNNISKLLKGTQMKLMYISMKYLFSVIIKKLR